MVTVKVKLEGGLLIDGVLHQEFEMREATIRDAINAIDQRNADGEDVNSYLTLQMYQAAQQLVSLGGLPKDKITGRVLLELPEDDIEPILNAMDDIKKKRKDAKPKLEITPS